MRHTYKLPMQMTRLWLKHHNGQVFEPMELSQSTKEILYISLRLSLIKVLKPYYHLPIIVDDAFVHFDKKKTYNAELFKRLAENHQVLYFTCTKDQIVPSKEMLVLNKLEEGGKYEKCRKFKSGDSVNHFSYS